MNSPLVLQLLLGDKTSQILGIGMKLGIFEELSKDELKSSTEISEKLKISFRSVDRILLYGTYFKFTEESEGKFKQGENWNSLIKIKDLAINFSGKFYEIILSLDSQLIKGEFSDKEFENFFLKNTDLFSYSKDSDILAKQAVSSVLLVELVHGLADKFDLFGVILKGKMSLKEIASLTKIKDEYLNVVLKYLTCSGFLAEKDGCYSLIGISQAFTSQGMFSVVTLKRIYSKFWRNFEYSVKTGKSAAEMEFKKPFFKYMKENEETRELYHSSIKKQSDSIPNLVLVSEVCPSLKLDEVKTVADIGGSTGSASLPLVKFTGIEKIYVLDLPEVVKDIKVEENVNDKIILVGGSFFEPKDIPKKCDIYLLRSVLHDWKKEKQLEIIDNIQTSMKVGSRLIIMELVFNRTFKGAATDLHTLACYGEAFMPSLIQFKEMCKEKNLEFILSKVMSISDNEHYPKMTTMVFEKKK